MQRFALALLAPVLFGAALEAQALTTSIVTEGLDRPVFATSPPGDQQRLFVVEHPGRIRIIKNGTLLPEPFLDLTPLMTCCPPPPPCCDEFGLLGLAFHPDYAQNGYFFVNLCDYWGPEPFTPARARPHPMPRDTRLSTNYTVPSTGPAALTSYILRFRVGEDPDVADFSSRQIVIAQAQIRENHNAGMIAFGPDGYLYTSFGEGGNILTSQSGESLLGKMLRLDVDVPCTPISCYGIPPTNPFVGNAAVRDEIWSVGLRNPFRFSFDRLTGDLYIGDVGQTVEEIIFEPAGAGGRNYGWPCLQGTACTGFGICSCTDPTLTPPIHEYDPGGCRAVIGGYMYRGTQIAGLQGTYFFADNCADRVWSMRYDGTTVSDFTERTESLDPGGARRLSVASFAEDADGELYMCSYHRGAVYKIVAAPPDATSLQAFGEGTPGCAGPHRLRGIRGDEGWRLRADGAAPLAPGWLVVGAMADRSQRIASGLALHVGIGAGTHVSPIVADRDGSATVALPLPGSAGEGSLFLQALWSWPRGECTPSPSGLSSSNAIELRW